MRIRFDQEPGDAEVAREMGYTADNGHPRGVKAFIDRLNEHTNRIDAFLLSCPWGVYVQGPNGEVMLLLRAINTTVAQEAVAGFRLRYPNAQYAVARNLSEAKLHMGLVP